MMNQKLDDLNTPREKPMWIRLVPKQRITIRKPPADVREFLEACADGISLVVRANKEDYSIELARGEREDQWMSKRLQRYIHNTPMETDEND